MMMQDQALQALAQAMMRRRRNGGRMGPDGMFFVDRARPDPGGLPPILPPPIRLPMPGRPPRPGMPGDGPGAEQPYGDDVRDYPAPDGWIPPSVDGPAGDVPQLPTDMGADFGGVGPLEELLRMAMQRARGGRR